jgi:hypothetical protein
MFHSVMLLTLKKAKLDDLSIIAHNLIKPFNYSLYINVVSNGFPFDTPFTKTDIYRQ